ncbi:hypothetical protein GCM10010156_51000 [Planobispora rosea]|uniref:Peptidase M10 metallopeptidase domain-containing protein n=1 Tax=Planobispora rosea TaxID=35762 RepID=A0A8J3WIN4_PLARO|nr:matrixin family metalloprotease [Planobispora rosea]GGS86268.1 hypothetical protein GCM10010156_51000 [Planobispora rosea]GIH89026.1 hypothetical protein Pro02_74340 [Planobispora rosea]
MTGRSTRILPVALALFAAFITLVVSVASTVDEVLTPTGAAPAPAPELTPEPAHEPAHEDETIAVAGSDLLVTVDAVYPGGRKASWTETGTSTTTTSLATTFTSTTSTAANAAGSRASAATAAAQCRDRAYALAKWRVKGRLGWTYNPSGAPSAVGRTALTEIKSAVQYLVAGKNVCRLPGPFKVGQAYKGATKLVPAVTATSRSTGCGKEDGNSVVGWKRLGSTALAVTCTWWTRTGQVVSADIAINTRYTWFSSRPSRCSSSFDLRSVLVHEWGHAYGLNHVSPAQHGTQVMASTIPACAVVRTLGAGDHAAMRKLYGVS